ncbi:MAG: hypothetical protein ACXIU7_01610 [Roseinatronobacter sp.]
MRSLTQSRAARHFIMSLMLLAASLLVAACDAPRFASEAQVLAARHVHGGAPELTLVTIVNRDTNRGDHTALFINGRERVLFDPAGSWFLDSVPERHDVHFGMTPMAGASFYVSHVRPTHFAVVQRLVVTPEVAEQAQVLALQMGPVSAARCAQTTSRLLRALPGFESIRTTWFPSALMRNFGALPGVMTYEIHHDDPMLQQKVLQVQVPL